MTFSYLSPPGAEDYPRPFLKVRLVGPKGGSDIFMLVDSGADETALPMWWARRLGLPFTGEKIGLGSFTGQGVSGSVCHVDLTFGDGAFTLESRAVAHPDIRVPVLGHRDFFQKFRVTFDAGRSTFEVEQPAVH